MRGIKTMLYAAGLALGYAMASSGITDAATARERWQQSAGVAQQRYVEGVQATTKDPTALASAAAQKLLANFQQSITSGRWQRNLSRVGKAGWQNATVAKAANFGTGIQASGDKYQTAMGPVLQVEAQLQQQIMAMPNNTIEDSIARSAAWQRGLHNWAVSR